jgi:uncharacterized protein (DUF2236 family)
MTAYDRYARPLSIEEKNRYLREQAIIGRMGGAEWVPETLSELEGYVERMRPRMSFNEQTAAFVDFLLGRTDDLRLGRAGQLDRFLSLHGSMNLMPSWAQRLTGTQCGPLEGLAVRAGHRARARLVRWSYPELPCKAIALARVQGHTSA